MASPPYGDHPIARLTELVAQIEAAKSDEQNACLSAVWALLNDDSPRHADTPQSRRFVERLDCGAFESAALSLLNASTDWRRFTPRSCSIYAASPYNAKAEVRHDGYGATVALQLCSAIVKMLLAKAKQAEKAR